MDNKPLFQYSYVTLFPEEQIDFHEQNNWELSYVVRGSGIRRIGDSSMPFSSGDMVIVPPHIPHCWFFDKDDTDSDGYISNISLMIEKEFLSVVSSSFPILKESVDVLMECKCAVSFPKKMADNIAGKLLAMKNMDDKHRLGIVIEIIVMLSDIGNGIVVSDYAHKDKAQIRMEKINTYIVCNVRRNITLDDIARHVGMNKAAFCVFFKKMTGKTFIQYFNEYSISMACQLLQTKSLSISEVCYRTGFNDIPYFNRLFKRITGFTPSQYALKNNNEHKIL